jgi:hypothetical protein
VQENGSSIGSGKPPSSDPKKQQNSAVIDAPKSQPPNGPQQLNLF